MPQERLPMCKIRDVLRLKAGGSTTPTPSDARRPARADVKRSQGRRLFRFVFRSLNCITVPRTALFATAEL